MANWVYIESEPGLWTVGHYGRGEQWFAESDHDSPSSATTRVAHLNGESVALDLQRVLLRLHQIDDAWHGMESAAAQRETEMNWAFCDIANPSRPLTDVYAHIYQSHRLAIREALAELISMTEAAQ